MNRLKSTVQYHLVPFQSVAITSITGEPFIITKEKYYTYWVAVLALQPVIATTLLHVSMDLTVLDISHRKGSQYVIIHVVFFPLT